MKEEWCRLKCLIKSSKHQTFFFRYLLLVRLLLKFHDIHADVHELVLHMNEMRTFGVYVRALMWNIWFLCLPQFSAFILIFHLKTRWCQYMIFFILNYIFQGNSRLFGMKRNWDKVYFIVLKRVIFHWTRTFFLETKPMVIWESK